MRDTHIPVVVDLCLCEAKGFWLLGGRKVAISVSFLIEKLGTNDKIFHSKH